MRWKEQFFINAKEECGLTIAGGCRFPQVLLGPEGAFSSNPPVGLALNLMLILELLSGGQLTCDDLQQCHSPVLFSKAC